jgi:hypothetical protein
MNTTNVYIVYKTTPSLEFLAVYDYDPRSLTHINNIPIGNCTVSGPVPLYQNRLTMPNAPEPMGPFSPLPRDPIRPRFAPEVPDVFTPARPRILNDFPSKSNLFD